MMARGLVVGAVIFVAMAAGSSARCQTRPATSGAASFYEPEPRPHGQGWYRPNVPGSPRVGSEAEVTETSPVRGAR